MRRLLSGRFRLKDNKRLVSGGWEAQGRANASGREEAMRGKVAFTSAGQL